ncbi:DNA-directed RNA polymerase core subunit rpc40 [Knufia obscura]|uniref:DNA-directed RNA polymerase core subunit rpc40 n=1 Tax=Knufia obscura TaxID=1635080 RepID=A0ABR0RIG6_9EURO|nr:DNA-directed RNA polymerase core subunit rpc40 [Knufia obscura]
MAPSRAEPPKTSEAELQKRKTVGINPETVTNITSTDFPGHHPGEDAAWSIDKFANGLTVQFHKNEPDNAEFSLVGIDASIANAFRRILIAEVPTLAIETCYINDNTSVIADEVLAHRLGLIPLKASLEGLKFMKWYIKGDPENGIEGMSPSDYNTIVLELKIKCEWKPNPPDEGEPEEKYNHSSVYARDIVWTPLGQQGERFKECPVQPVNPGILIAKLRPGQEIHVVMHAHLGKGADHAKFSPVGTATYRLLPKIDIVKPILGSDARKFQKCFAKGVIEVERVTPQDRTSAEPAYHGREGDEKAVVKNPMLDTVSRECLRHDEFKGKVKLGRVQDHFIFSVESTGQFASDLLFLESVKVLKYKAKSLLRALDKYER